MRRSYQTVIPGKAGIQKAAGSQNFSSFENLDSRLRGNDIRGLFELNTASLSYTARLSSGLT